MDDRTKTCCTCGAKKPLTDFNRYSLSPDGRQPRCRECQRTRRVEWYAKNREAEIAKARAWNLANPERVREIDRARRARDPEKHRAKNRATYRKHRAKYQARLKAKRLANLSEFRERERLWREANRAGVAERKRRYRLTNPNIRLAEKAKFHARRSRMEGGATGPQIEARIDFYGGRCWICGSAATTIDHVKPLAKGGSHLAANLRPACAPCNFRKHARWWGASRLAELAAWVARPAA